jgi:hypothetical protein
VRLLSMEGAHERVAQSVEHVTFNHGVVGSIPTALTIRSGSGYAVANIKTVGAAMSVFAVNYLCREVLRDHAFRAAMKADPAKALADLDLTDDERGALIAGNVGALYRMGVNGFLMGYLARFEVCGLNVPNYN